MTIGAATAVLGKVSTSRAAARSVAGVSGEVRQQVLDFIQSMGPYGATIEEIKEGTGLVVNTVCPRRKELEDMGYVVDSGRRRPGKTGRYAIVWVASSEPTVAPPKTELTTFQRGVLHLAKQVAKAPTLADARRIVALEVAKIKKSR